MAHTTTTIVGLISLATQRDTAYPTTGHLEFPRLQISQIKGSHTRVDDLEFVCGQAAITTNNDLFIFFSF